MRLNRRCNRSLNCPLATLLITRLDGHPYRRRNDLAAACRALTMALRISKRLTKNDPHLFGPHAHQYYLDTVAQAQEAEIAEAALRKVYGPPQPGDPPPLPDVFTRRYFLDPQWKGFRKWFADCYGA